MNSCFNCGAGTKNPKFCSRSCAATLNNQAHPKRKKTNNCKNCSKQILASRTYCQKCSDAFDLGNKRIFETSRSSILNHAKRIYEGPLECRQCGYDLHVDICHIKPIRDFDVNTPISEINAKDNLVALCKNHHWELRCAELLPQWSK
jgi:hypothetical protein